MKNEELTLRDMVPFCDDCDIVMGHRNGHWTCARCGAVKDHPTDKTLPDYKGFRITEVHAITGIGDDDEEGIPAIMTTDGPLPLISSDRVRLEQLKIMAQQIANQTGQSYKIVRFSAREDIGTIEPERKP
jgi:hypothetical protein